MRCRDQHRRLHGDYCSQAFRIMDLQASALEQFCRKLYWLAVKELTPKLPYNLYIVSKRFFCSDLAQVP